MIFWKKPKNHSNNTFRVENDIFTCWAWQYNWFFSVKTWCMYVLSELCLNYILKVYYLCTIKVYIRIHFLHIQYTCLYINITYENDGYTFLLTYIFLQLVIFCKILIKSAGNVFKKNYKKLQKLIYLPNIFGKEF